MGNWKIVIPRETASIASRAFVDDSGNLSFWSSIPLGSSTLELERLDAVQGWGSLKVTPDSAQPYGGARVGLKSSLITIGDTLTATVIFKGVKDLPYRIFFSGTNSAPAAGNSTKTFIATGDWQKVTHTYTTQSFIDRFGFTKSNSSSADPFYVGGVMVEKSDTPSTYGNEYADGWDFSDGLNHRPISTRYGGIVLDLESDYGLTVEAALGGGMPPIKHRTHPRPGGAGINFRSTKPAPRTLSLMVSANGNDWSGLHKLRKDLIDAIKPDLDSVDQPLTIIYTGANPDRPLFLHCYYDSGLEMGKTSYLLERIELRFIAYDPFWKEEFTFAAGAVSAVELTPSRALAREDGVWSNMNGGFNNTVYAAAITPNGEIIVGGSFTTANGATATVVNGLAKWDRSANAWVPLSNAGNIGVSGGAASVYALAVSPGGDIYVGGNFTSLLGLAANNFGWLFSGVSPQTYGTGVNGTVQALAYNPHFAYPVVIGGDFSTANGSSIPWFAFFEMTAGFRTLVSQSGSPNPDGAVLAFAVSPDGSLYVGGSFTTPGTRVFQILPPAAGSSGVSVKSLAGGVSATVYALTVDKRGTLIAGGEFLTADGLTVNSIARWEGSAWSPMSSGVWNSVSSGTVYALATGPDGEVYVGGDFLTAGTREARGIAVWLGEEWATPDVQFHSDSSPYAIVAPNQTDLYIFGPIVNQLVCGTKFTITNRGTSSSKPIVRLLNVSSPHSARWIRNYTTGQTLYLDAATPGTNDVITLDLRDGHRRYYIRTMDSSASPIDYPTAVIRQSAADEFVLLPGENEIGVYGFYFIGSIPPEIYIEYPAQHWSLDGTAE